MKLLDTAEIKDIQSLISNENILNVKVNFYQRPYRWTAKKITDLFDDYRENRLSSLQEGGSSKEYFVGAAVFVDERSQAEKDAGKVWNYQVVDGQQRLTTLYLFNYLKYLLLIRKVDEAAQKNKSRDFNAGLEAMENCYRGFIGTTNVETIIKANSALSDAFDTANQNRVSINIEDLNKWRSKVGWIENPDISSDDYFDKCKDAMAQFLKSEKLSIYYENKSFNERFKEGLSQIVIKFSDASDAAFCDNPIEEYDENDETRIEFPYVIRAYGVFDQIKALAKQIRPECSTPYDKLCSYIELIDEMLENIKLCLIVTSVEDDAYKLFETLNDRSESVNDLELLKNYFFKTYTETSGEETSLVYNNISAFDTRWRNIFFKCEDLEPEIFEYMTVLFTGNTNKNTNEKKRKLVKSYLSKYDSATNKYTYEMIDRDFKLLENIQAILFKLHRIDMSTFRKENEDAQMSLYIENDSSSSIVKRALGLAMNLPYPVVVASLICDILHNYITTSSNMTFDSYLDYVFDESKCKDKFPGLWKDSCVIWKAVVLSKNFESPKKLSDVLAQKCYVEHFNEQRATNTQLIQFDANILEEETVISEFDDWIKEWKFSDGNGKLKIKNLFMHLFLKYDLDTSNGDLILSQNIVRSYTQEAIKQDLDHMDAAKVDRSREKRYFHYNLSDRTDYTNSLGNMMPLPVAINRGKHNTPMDETLAAYPTDNLVGWIFDLAQDDFDNNNETIDGHLIPTTKFFNQRKDRLIAYFKKIVENQKFSPSARI